MIAILCPTRRPEHFRLLVQNVTETSSGRATVLGYVDADDEPLYAADQRLIPAYVTVGPRVGPAHALNRLVEDLRFDIYGLIPDDARIATQDWDLWVEGMVNTFVGRLGVVSPYQEGMEFCNFPFVTRELVDLMGWFSPPGFYHFMYDTVWELLAEGAGCIRYAARTEMHVGHQAHACMNRSAWESDLREYIRWSREDRLHQLRRLRQAQANSLLKK